LLAVKWVEVLSTALVVGMTIGSCSTSHDDPVWNPMVMEMRPGTGIGDSGGGDGTISITRGCVVLRIAATGRSRMLVWRAGQARWDFSDHTILFTDVNAGKLKLRDGAHIGVGGELLDPTAALSRPLPETCGDDAFVVGQVELLPD
jgi:hypothetical protein